MNSSKVFLCVLAGITTGTLVGMLFAPEKGSKIRKNILNKGEGYAEIVKEKFDELMDMASKKIAKTWHNAEGLMSNEDPKSKKEEDKSNKKATSLA
jgi:gas vesicle protein